MLSEESVQLALVIKLLIIIYYVSVMLTQMVEPMNTRIFDRVQCCLFEPGFHGKRPGILELASALPQRV